MIRRWLRRLWTAYFVGASVPTADVSTWEQFTRLALQAVRRAQQEATRQGSPLVEPIHLWLGLLEASDSLAVLALKQAGIAPETLRAGWHTASRPRDASPDPLLGTAGWNALNFARVEARRLGCKYIGAEHLLLGLIAETQWRRDEVWARHGASLAQVRDAVAALTGGQTGVWPPPPRPQGYEPHTDVQA